MKLITKEQFVNSPFPDAVTITAPAGFSDMLNITMFLTEGRLERNWKNPIQAENAIKTFLEWKSEKDVSLSCSNAAQLKEDMAAKSEYFLLISPEELKYLVPVLKHGCCGYTMVFERPITEKDL